MKIYVGNLTNGTSERDIRTSFEKYGKIASINILMDKTDLSLKGFAFIEMPSDKHAQEAIIALDGQSLSGSLLVVNEARKN